MPNMEIVHDDSLHHDEVYELELNEYGEVYEPNASKRVSMVPRIVPSGHEAYIEGSHEHVDEHGEQPYYGTDASSGKQGAGK